MTPADDRQPPRVAVIGLGLQGTSITRLSLDLGYDVLGAVDVGEKVGRPMRELVDHPRTPDTDVFASIDELIATRGKPDVAVLAALMTTQQNAELAARLLERGINLLALDANLFEGQGPFAERLAAAGQAGGATLVTTGMQDLWWLHLPAVAAAGNHRITRIAFNDFSNCARFTREIGVHEAALGLALDEFEAWAQPHLAGPPIQGSPIRECALRMGFTPGEMRVEIQPVTQDEPADWFAAGIVIPPGRIVGARYLVEIPTQEGPVFTGDLLFQVKEASQASTYTLTISGDAELTIHVGGFPGWLAVPLGLVRRIPDVIEAPPGVVRVADLPPARYAHPVG